MTMLIRLVAKRFQPCYPSSQTGFLLLRASIEGSSTGCFTPAVSSIVAATQMNSIRKQLLARYPNAEETFGYIAKEHRQIAKLPNNDPILRDFEPTQNEIANGSYRVFTDFADITGNSAWISEQRLRTALERADYL